MRIAHLSSKEGPFVWKCRGPGLNCVSPVVANGLLFMVSDQGLVWCIDAEPGALIWKQQLKATHYSSPIVAGEGVCF